MNNSDYENGTQMAKLDMSGYFLRESILLFCKGYTGSVTSTSIVNPAVSYCFNDFHVNS